MWFLDAVKIVITALLATPLTILWLALYPLQG
jgi:hypothetical protein